METPATEVLEASVSEEKPIEMIPASSQPLDLGDFGLEPTPPAPTASQPLDFGMEDATEATAVELEDDGSAFMGGWTAATADEAAPVPVQEPEIDDPRLKWKKKNDQTLKTKNAEEAAAKKVTTDKAAAHMKKQQEARAKTMSARKSTNRAPQKNSAETGVPMEGTSWEKINAMVNFGSSGGTTHAKDVTRFRNILITQKGIKA
eukprot:CAMPEP_0119107546 /NCGR_PEP_ID=MMETSP1180-20130426/11072_1 /TAXON_ID=3052 ORGANISM="Chlamydomonas cf sp, Strain CCMP681" /NCGR_SAMPLE_ID=MMETSP1180 /ASSEMBLY_ACC=CAM_ASM_000741 /LENGTH=203 /DNA_ID=CAMNT_0007093051 /DNA_START=81 /DNA_END=692 /DNA_ORIENTATION=+